MTTLSVLILADRLADAERMVRALRRAGFDPQWQCVHTEAEYSAHLDQPIDLILADYTLPQFDALRALHLLQRRGLDIPFIIVTGTVSEEAAVESLKQGAADYLLKDRLARLGQAAKRALQEKAARDAARRAAETLSRNEHLFRRLAEQNEVLADIARIASSSLDIGEVYEQCAHEVAKLIQFDRMAVNLVDVDHMVAIRAYRTGAAVPEHDERGPIPLSGSMTWEVVQKATTLLLQGNNNDDQLSRYSQVSGVVQAGFHSFLATPLTARDKVVGVILLVSRQANAYLPEHGHLLERVAHQISGAAANAQLFAELKEAEARAARSATEKEALLRVSRALTCSLGLRTRTELALDAQQELVGMDFVVIRFLDQSSGQLALLGQRGGTAEMLHKIGGKPPPRIGEGLSGTVAQSGKPLVIEDLPSNSGPLHYQGSLGAGFASYVGVPLKVEDRVVGVMSGLSRQRRRFTPSDMELLESFGNMVGLALDNSRLFDQAEAQAQEWERTFNGMSNGIFLLDAEHHILRANRALASMLGTTTDALLGQHCYEAIHGQDAPIAGCVGRRCLAEKRPCTLVRQEPNLGSRWISLTAEPMANSRGAAVTIIHSVRDVTDQKRLEDQYYQAQKMESVGRLAGGVAHDFNNLLTAILGYAEIGQAALPQDSPLHPYFDEIHGAGERAAALTRQLLAFSRRQAFHPRTVCLADLVANLANMLRRLIGEDIELDIPSTPDIWPVKADPGQTEQVLVNLAINARDAMPGGGKLTIETANTTLDQGYARQHANVTPGDYVVVSVTDTGTGMSAEVKEHLFEPFFTTKPQGTGLGLATCYGIIKQSGGHIAVDSEPGLGTIVRFYLPRTGEDASDGPQAQPVAAPKGNETILLAEDEAAVREMTATGLRHLGYSVLEARDGTEALRFLQEHASATVHLLLTDVVMPQMGGKELADKVKALRPDIRVLFMSGYASESIAPGGELEPGALLLQKPFTPSSLGQKVRQALDR
ncbi:MAG: GAF domain-containing protein [Chloroflexi bacterium]|nr:GAF domain-containing protein [Chloroflexota bacterium]